MRWHGVFSLIALAVAPVRTVFIDEAFSVDFHHALLGAPQPHTTFFHKPHLSSNASLLYTLSDKAVLGAVNPRDGSIVWRQSIAESPLDGTTRSYLVAGRSDGKVTAAAEKQVTAWDASDGRLVWTHTVQGDSRVAGLQVVPVVGSSADGGVQDVVLLTRPEKDGGSYAVTRLGGDGSGERWHHNDPDTKHDAVVAIASSPKNLFYITRSAGLLSGQKTKVVVLDIATGKTLKELSLGLDSESVSSNGGLVSASGTAAPFMITSEKPYKTLKLNLLGSSKISTISLEDKNEEIVAVKVFYDCGPKDQPHFLVHVQTATRHWAEVYHVNTATGDASRKYSLPATEEASAFSASSNANNVYFTRVTTSEVLVYSSESHGHIGRWTRKQLGLGHQFSNDPVLATAEVASRDPANTAVRVAVTSLEGIWYLIRNGDTQWSRPEMLAYAEFSTWSDDISADSLAQELGTETSVDPATAYINRVYRHALELVQLPSHLMQLPKTLFGTPQDHKPLRQDLLGSRSLILATKQKRIYSISGTTGKTQWHADLSSTIAVDSSIRSLTAADGRVILYTSDGSIVVVNATNGHAVESKLGSIPVAKIIELPGSPASTILKIDDNGVPQHASDLAPSVPYEGNVVMTLDRDGQVAGWTVGTTIKKTWTFKPSHSKIIAINGRPAHDPIASVGKVLGDRSVLYKYFTPNLGILTAVSSSMLTIYLVDGVTGTVLHTVSHQGVLTSLPISTVLSENWFAYTFTSSNPETKALSTQLIVSELYESSIPNDRGQLSSKTNYSSFGPDANSRPHVVSAAFTLAEPISHLSVTQTAQGISTRQILGFLPNSNAIIAIPRHFLEARRPVDRDPTPAEAEEGLFRYNPYLDIDPKFFLSHSLEVVGIKEISTVPTLLESTSTVLGFGHDVFGTQVSPSQTFDVLGKSFNKIQLILTVVALYLGVLAIRPLVRRKVVQRGWS